MKLCKSAAVIFLLTSLASAAWSQQSAPNSKDVDNLGLQVQDQAQNKNHDPTQPQPQAPPNAPSAADTPPAKETTISPTEAKELFRSVDEILQFASEDTGLH